jgi:hypothetical protein
MRAPSQKHPARVHKNAQATPISTSSQKEWIVNPEPVFLPIIEVRVTDRKIFIPYFSNKSEAARAHKWFLGIVTRVS